MLAASHSWHRLQPRQSLTFAASAVRSRSRITFLNCFKEGKFLSLGVRSFQSLGPRFLKLVKEHVCFSALP